MTITKGHSEICSCPCDKEDISTIILKEYAGLIERVKQTVPSGKKESENDSDTKSIVCAEVLQSGHTNTGVYTIWPKNSIIIGSVAVYCDIDKDGRGWTFIQRRGDYGQPEDYFFKDWESYKKEFGDTIEDFWLGNDLIFAITNQARYSITEFSPFMTISGLKMKRSNINSTSVTTVEMQVTVWNFNNNMKFSTKDRDNDLCSGSCAIDLKGAWWYKDCSNSNLNGLYLKGKSSEESMSITEMKIRPKSFQKV